MEVKILDFGIARAAFQADTKHRIVRGKYAYMSPEQVEGKTLDGRSDMFSLGIVLYETLTERRLFKAKNRDPEGRLFTVAGTGKRGFLDGPAMEATFFEPKHICVDTQDRVFIADDKNNAIRLYDPQRGEVRTILGGKGEEGVLKGPHGVCVHAGDLYIVDSGNNRVLRMNIADDTE